MANLDGLNLIIDNSCFDDYYLNMQRFIERKTRTIRILTDAGYIVDFDSDSRFYHVRCNCGHEWSFSAPFNSKLHSQCSVCFAREELEKYIRIFASRGWKYLDNTITAYPTNTARCACAECGHEMRKSMSSIVKKDHIDCPTCTRSTKKEDQIARKIKNLKKIQIPKEPEESPYIVLEKLLVNELGVDQLVGISASLKDSFRRQTAAKLEKVLREFIDI